MDNGFNVGKDLKTKSVEELRIEQEKASYPYSIILLNLTGDLNIGVAIRTASLLGAESVHVFGRRRIDRRSLVGTQNYITIYREDGLDEDGNIDFSQFIKYCEKNELNPVLVEHGGVPLPKINWKADGRYWKPCFVFGNEGSGIPEEFLCSDLPVISIPQIGVMASYNVSSAASIVMWDYVSRRFLT